MPTGTGAGTGAGTFSSTVDHESSSLLVAAGVSRVDAGLRPRQVHNMFSVVALSLWKSVTLTASPRLPTGGALL